MRGGLGEGAPDWKDNTIESVTANTQHALVNIHLDKTARHDEGYTAHGVLGRGGGGTRLP